VRAAARLHRDVELGAFGGHVEKQPPMIDLENVGAEIAQQGCDVPKHARAIRDRQPERGDASLAFELAHHDGRQQPRIDVPAAQDQPDIAATEALGLEQHRGEPRRHRPQPSSSAT
jgi:hypothetical protein